MPRPGWSWKSDGRELLRPTAVSAGYFRQLRHSAVIETADSGTDFEGGFMQMRTWLCAGTVLAFICPATALAQTETPPPPGPDAVAAAEDAAQQAAQTAAP